MTWLRNAAAVMLLGGMLHAASRPAETCPAEQANGAGGCAAKKEVREAQESFAHGLKLQKSEKPEEAFLEFEHAASLLPHNVEYVTAREVARQQLVYSHIEAGNEATRAGEPTKALAEFRAASALDPDNVFAAQRLKDALGEQPAALSPGLRLVAQADEIAAQPQAGQRAFHFRGDTRGLVEEVARQFGLKVRFDDSVQTRPVRFEVEKADFATAMQLASEMSKTFWTPMSDSEIYVAADTPENRRQFERMSLRTFYLPYAEKPEQLNEVTSLLRGVFDLRLFTPQPAQSLLTVRGPKRSLDAATRLLEELETGRPQVQLEVEVFLVSQTGLMNLGVQMPAQIIVFNVPTEAQQLATQPGVQSLINQLIASGGINQANSVAIAALLAQLGGQQSLLTQPFAVFGGGTTLEGVNLGKLTVNAQYDHAHFQNLEHMTMRASQGNASTFFVGERFPVVNATFSPILNSPALSAVIQTGTFAAPFPSFNFEDIGMTVKATPEIHADADVTLKLELTLKQLTGQQFNGIPVIGNREYKGAITLKDGEPAAVAGEVEDVVQYERSGLPVLGQIPLFGRALSNENAQSTRSELLVVITPHVVDLPQRKSAASELWMGAGDTR